jgi:hypothetical protein
MRSALVSSVIHDNRAHKVTGVDDVESGGGEARVKATQSPRDILKLQLFILTFRIFRLLFRTPRGPGCYQPPLRMSPLTTPIPP